MGLIFLTISALYLTTLTIHQLDDSHSVSKVFSWASERVSTLYNSFNLYAYPPKPDFRRRAEFGTPSPPRADITERPPSPALPPVLPTSADVCRLSQKGSYHTANMTVMLDGFYTPCGRFKSSDIFSDSFTSPPFSAYPPSSDESVAFHLDTVHTLLLVTIGLLLTKMCIMDPRTRRIHQNICETPELPLSSSISLPTNTSSFRLRDIAKDLVTSPDSTPLSTGIANMNISSTIISPSGITSHSSDTSDIDLQTWIEDGLASSVPVINRSMAETLVAEMPLKIEVPCVHEEGQSSASSLDSEKVAGSVELKFNPSARCLHSSSFVHIDNLVSPDAVASLPMLASSSKTSDFGSEVRDPFATSRSLIGFNRSMSETPAPGIQREEQWEDDEESSAESSISSMASFVADKVIECIKQEHSLTPFSPNTSIQSERSLPATPAPPTPAMDRAEIIVRVIMDNGGIVGAESFVSRRSTSVTVGETMKADAEDEERVMRKVQKQKALWEKRNFSPVAFKGRYPSMINLTN